MTRSSPERVAAWPDVATSAVSPNGSILYRPLELIVRSGAVDALERALGERLERAEQTPLGLTRVIVADRTDLPARLGVLRSDMPRLAAQTSPNYVLAPWVSSGSDGAPVPATGEPPPGSCGTCPPRPRSSTADCCAATTGTRTCATPSR